MISCRICLPCMARPCCHAAFVLPCSCTALLLPLRRLFSVENQPKPFVTFCHIVSGFSCTFLAQGWESRPLNQYIVKREQEAVWRTGVPMNQTQRGGKEGGSRAKRSQQSRKTSQQSLARAWQPVVKRYSTSGPRSCHLSSWWCSLWLRCCRGCGCRPRRFLQQFPHP